MELKKEDILHIAHLGHIRLSPADVTRFQTELSHILEYMDQLKTVDVTGVEPLHQVTGIDSVTRPDEVEECTDTPCLIAGFPEQDKQFLKVTSVFGKRHE